MADSDWKELVKPLRKTAMMLNASAAALRETGNDEHFWRLFAQLDSLPEAATVQAFGATTGWQSYLLEKEPVQQQAAEARIDRSSLTTKGSRPQPRNNIFIATKEAAARPASTEQKSTQKQKRFVVKGSLGEKTPADADYPATSAKQTLGARTALERIAELTKELESRKTLPIKTERRAPLSTVTDHGQVISKQKNIPVNIANKKKQFHLKTSPATSNHTAVTENHHAATNVATNEANQKITRATPPKDVHVDLLAKYVNQVWQLQSQSKSAEQTSLRVSNIVTDDKNQAVTRAPSRLLPDYNTTGYSPTAEQETKNNGPERGLTKASERENNNLGNQTKKTQESIDKQINRSLKEQAWLRGVDLT